MYSRRLKGKEKRENTLVTRTKRKEGNPRRREGKMKGKGEQRRDEEKELRQKGKEG